jgi:hypothetical protein
MRRSDIKAFAHPIKVSLKPLGRLARAAGGGGRAPQSAKAYMALLFDSFFFVPAHAKKKRVGI